MFIRKQTKDAHLLIKISALLESMLKLWRSELGVMYTWGPFLASSSELSSLDYVIKISLYTAVVLLFA